MSKSDFIRTAAVSPALKVANTSYNTDRIIACAREAADNGAAVILFPELAIPSYTCGDLFFQQHLYEGNLKGLSRIIEASASLDAVIIAGFYLRIICLNFFSVDSVFLLQGSRFFQHNTAFLIL